MFNNQFMKAGMGVMLSSALVLSACSGDDTDKNGGQTPVSLVESAKQDIAAKRYSDALNKCTRAEEMDDTYDEAKYCVLATNVGALVQSVASIITLVAGQLSPAEYEKSINAKQLVSSVLSEIEGQMAYIDTYAYKLAEMENPHFKISDFPLGLDPSDLLKIAGTEDIQISGDLSLNMAGTWDKSQAVVLGAAINGVQGVIDYLLSHKLILDSTDIDFDSTEGVAQFLMDNADLLAGDTSDTGRLKGDATHKGLKLDVLAAISYLVGRDAAMEKVAPAFGGLKEAIKASAAEAAPDAVVKWVDADGDGIPEEIGLPALSQLKDKILDGEGKPIIEKDTFENPLAKETWDEILAFGISVRDNIEADGGDAISLAPLLEAIIADVKDEESTTRLLFRPVPDLIGLNPGAFLKDPKYIADMLPYYFTFNYAGETTKHADLALEIETYAGSTTFYNEKVGVMAYENTTGTFPHFKFSANDDLDGDAIVEAYLFDLFDTTPAQIADDGVKADAKSPNLYYIALQDPTIGGLIQGDLAAAGNYGEITSASFNEGLARLVKYYCLDFTMDLLDSFDNSKYGAENQIAACTNPF